MINILIADDHIIVREGLKHILSEISDICLIDEANNGQEVLDKVHKNDYNLIILDISFPGRGGLDILKQIKLEKPNLSVLILSMHPEEQYGARALSAGASGYLTKECIPEKLVGAIRKIAAGRKYISPTLAEKLAENLGQGLKKSVHEILSDREYQVMCMMGNGKTVKEIASDLNLSSKTISTYRSRVLEKMQLKNNAELTHYVVKNGLIY
jgi:two-component system invasion response regulator UvrY